MMVKIRKEHISFLILVAMLVVISSCTKPECRTSSDCGLKACAVAKCQDKKCAYAPQSNCCGNGIKDAVENGRPGSQCTCPADYGKCEGKGKVKIGSRMEDATYAHYYCSIDSQCILGVERKDAVPLNYLDSINTGFFKASSVVRYNKPFDANSDAFEFAVTLDDSGKDVILPITITKAKILYNSEFARSELLVAEKDMSAVLNGIGDKAVINLPLTLSYRPQELEESGSIRYSMDYMYKRQVLSGKTVNGTNIYSNETARATFTAPVKPVLLVRSG